MYRVCIQYHTNKSHYPHVLPIAKRLKELGVIVDVFVENPLDIKCLDSNELFFFDNIIYARSNLSFKFKYAHKILYRFVKEKLVKIFVTDNALDSNLSYYLNSNYLSKLDAFIFSDLYNGKIIKKINPALKVVWGLHGPIGANSFIDKINRNDLNVDLVLSPGSSTADKFKYIGLNTHVIGSVKLEYFKKKPNIVKGNIFNNSNLIVLFNPHFNSEGGASAWEFFGVLLFDFFVEHPDLNLIFAPHPNLSKTFNLSVLEKYEKMDNIHIDIESVNLSNLYYESITDVYVGDISSQVFEYVALKNRKLIFLSSSKKINPDAYDIFDLGTLMETWDKKLFLKTIKSCFTIEDFEKQRKYISLVFSPDIESPSMIAAKSIVKLIDTHDIKH